MSGLSSQNFPAQEETRSGKPYGKLFETVQRLFTVLTSFGLFQTVIQKRHGLKVLCILLWTQKVLKWF